MAAMLRRRKKMTAKPATAEMRIKRPEYLVQSDGDTGQAAHVPSPKRKKLRSHAEHK